MKKLLLILLASMAVSNSFGQPKDKINLPDGGKDIKITQLTQLYSLYITKNQEVYNDSRKLEYFQDVSYNLFDQKNKAIEPWIPQKVLLYADCKVRYKFIDKVKKHIPYHRWIFYMTENIEHLTATAFRNYSPVKGMALEEITTLEQEIKNEELNKSVSPPPLPPPNMWYVDLEETLYSGKKEAIEEALKEYMYDTVTVLPNKKLGHNGAVINSESLKGTINANDVLFLKFNKEVLYEDYISAIQKIKKHQIDLERKQENKAYVVEVSFELQKQLERMDVSLQLPR